MPAVRTGSLDDDQDRLLDMLDAWQQGRAAGREPTPDELCPDDEPLRELLREHIAAAIALEPVSTAGTVGEGEASTHADLPPAPPGYTVIRELGRGGMGVVYEAVQTRLNRPVALKMIRGGTGGTGGARFLAEAEAVAAARHPNVVQVYESGESGGRAFLAMEYLAGGTLADRLATGGRMEAGAAAELVAKLARGVQAAHDRQIVHRDLKPGNVLFDHAGEPKVTDFGLAKHADREDMTATGVILGSPAYMAPEQADGLAKFVGPGADVYALGVVLYECLTGTRPFAARTPAALVRMVVEAEPESPRRRTPAVPRDLELICLKCLRKEPGERYPTAAALGDDLANFLAGRPVSARPVRWPVRLSKWVRRNPVPAALVLAVVLGSVGTSAAALVARERARERTEAISARAEAEREAAESEVAQLAAERDRSREIVRRNRAEREANVANAAQNNDFARVAALVVEAEKDGQTVSPDIQFAAAEALSTLGRYQELRERLERLVARTDLSSELRARVELRLADELQGTDDERAAALFTSARRSGQLPPADVVYSDAFVAPTMPEAIKLFYKCLELDPAHFPARRLLCTYLSMSGRLDEAIRIGEQNQLLAPNHPDVLWPLFLAYAFKGDRARARTTLERLRRNIPAELHEPVELIAEYLPQINLAFKSALAGVPFPIDDLGERLKIIRARGLIAAPGAPLPNLLQTWLERFPSAARSGYSEFWEFTRLQSQIGYDYAGELGRDEVRLARLKTRMDTRPEGFMRFVYAFSLMKRAQGYKAQYGIGSGHGNRYREMLKMAGDAYLLAADTPGLVDVRAVALDASVLAYGTAGVPNWTKERDEEALAKAAEAVKTRLADPEPILAQRYPLFVAACRHAGDFTTARRVLDEWERRAPNNQTVTVMRAYIEFHADAYLPALRAARAVLHREATHAEMRQLEAACLAQLKHDPNRVAPPPRAK